MTMERRTTDEEHLEMAGGDLVGEEGADGCGGKTRNFSLSANQAWITPKVFENFF